MTDPTHWHCLDPQCRATGTTNASADRHVKDAGHATNSGLEVPGDE